MREEVSIVLKPSTCVSSFEFSPYFEYLEHLFENHHQYSNEDRNEYNFWDYLQNPLQPLAENLENAVYETLEFDSPKYKTYEAAFTKAMVDFKNLGGKFNQAKQFDDQFPELGSPKVLPGGATSDLKCVVMVLGAGRGPLVDRALKAAKEAGIHIKVYAVEKNIHAVNTLRNRMLEPAWRGKVDIVHSDMRDWKPKEEADIIASELLGSFGDNELSPECLDPTEPFLKKTGIYIPCRYISYAQPISSQRLWEKASQQKIGGDSVENTLELGYVVRLTSFSLVGMQPEACFQFSHPRQIETNDMFKVRSADSQSLQFSHQCQMKKEIHGFAGFFEAQLYQDVVCSILPKTHTPKMRSWFPIYFPIREPMIVEGGEKVWVNIWRKSDMEKVWYEWEVAVGEEDRNGGRHNVEGRSYGIKKL